MTEDEFWDLIDEHIDKDALSALGEDDYPEELMDSLVEKLSALDVEEIQQFEERLAKALFDIDGKRFADNAGDSGQSGDGFLYCRCWVVANGKDYYQRIFNSPSDMPTSISQWLEPLLYVSSRAWAEKTGNDEEAWDYDTQYSYESGSNESEWND